MREAATVAQSAAAALMVLKLDRLDSRRALETRQLDRETIASSGARARRQGRLRYRPRESQEFRDIGIFADNGIAPIMSQSYD